MAVRALGKRLESERAGGKSKCQWLHTASRNRLRDGAGLFPSCTQQRGHGEAAWLRAHLCTTTPAREQRCKVDWVPLSQVCNELNLSKGSWCHTGPWALPRTECLIPYTQFALSARFSLQCFRQQIPKQKIFVSLHNFISERITTQRGEKKGEKKKKVHWKKLFLFNCLNLFDSFKQA